MAISPRSLACVLTCLMAAWLAAPIHSGPSGSGWWGSQEAIKLRQAARLSTVKGDLAEAERIYQHAGELAARHRDPVARAWSLEGVGDTRFANFNYRGALDAYLQAKTFAERARDPLVLGAIDGNLSSVYQQMSDFDSALRLAEEARKITQGLAKVYYRPQLLFMLGLLRHDEGSIKLFKEGIQAAQSVPANEPSQAFVEANGWDYLAESLIESGDLDRAEEAARKALALRQKSAAGVLGFSYGILGALRLRQAAQTRNGDRREKLLAEAEGFTRQATREKTGPPAYRLEYQRGSILLAQQRIPEALEAFEKALDQAQRWRLGIAPVLTSLDGAASELQSKIFDGFVDAAASYGIQAHDQRWVEESFEASELNRAMNLRDIAQSTRRRTMPPEYWEVLAQLQREETRLSRSNSEESPLSSNLRMRLTELEAEAGLGYSPNIAESFPSHPSLIHFQQSLRDSDILLSFALGGRESFLWAVTRDTLQVYRLPPADQIVNTVRAFRQAVEARTVGFEDLGGRLYGMLFGQLSAREASKPAWQLSAADALLEVPFAALVLEHERRSGQIVFLAERHSLEVKAGALLPGKPPQRPLSGFVSVGDPIYNIADPRWKAERGWKSGNTWFPILSSSDTTSQFNRLPGSRREVEASAAAWDGAWAATRDRVSTPMVVPTAVQSPPAPTVVLEGAEASRARFLEALSPVPEVIHLATHALSTGSGDDAYLAFGLGRDGRSEMLSTSIIRTLQVPGAVVVMTGCSTAPSDVRPGLGMAGLARAWAVAGASAVVATEWPVQDSAGSSLLASFYRHLRNVPEGTVAEALRLAQVEAIHAGNGLGKAPATATWAAYQVFASQLGAGSEAP